MGGFPHLHVPAEHVQTSDEDLAKLPSSAQRLFRCILEHGPLSHAELHRLTAMPPRTIRFALRRLRDEEMLDSRMSLQDCRTGYFFVHPNIVSESYKEKMRGAEHKGLGIHVLPGREITIER